MAAAKSDPRWILAGTVLVTVAVYLIPNPWGWYAGWPFRMLSTIAHESGHGLAALAAGCSWTKLEMWGNASGVASYACAKGTPLRDALISAGGLVGPAGAAMLLFGLGRGPRRARVGLFLLGLAALAADVLVVRSTVGWLVATALAVLCLGVALRWREGAQPLALFFGVQLALSVFSRGDYLFMAEAKTSAGTLPSDSAQIASALGGTYVLWGAVCGGVSIVALLLGLAVLMRGRGSSTVKRPAPA